MAVYFALIAGTATFVVWSLIGSGSEAVERTITVLVIACPHALGLAIPLVTSLSSAVAAKAGILVKDQMALERMRSVNVVVFDKTGTLTRGKHAVTGVGAVQGFTDDQIVALAGAVEADSEHPLAKVTVIEAHRRGAVLTATDFSSMTGRGVEASVDGSAIAVGGPALLRERKLSIPESLVARNDEWSSRGAAVLVVVRGSAIVGLLALEDEVRTESKQAVAQLQQQGIKVVMITGDAKSVAEAVAAKIGVDEVVAEVLPQDKEHEIANLQAAGFIVAMVGDGVNDAPALARADVGVAIGAGTDVAIASAGIVLVSSDPRSVTGVVRLSKATYRKMVQNLVWGAGYNLFAIPLAAGVFAFAGVNVSPAFGAIVMSASTIVVALNAQLLRRLDLRPVASSSP
jgi:P-type Cu2+ transporter